MQTLSHKNTAELTVPVHFVNIRENSSYVSLRTLQHTSSVIRNKLGIPGFDFHSLRHTHEIYLRDNGVPEIYISRRLGHKNIVNAQPHVRYPHEKSRTMAAKIISFFGPYLPEAEKTDNRTIGTAF